MRKNNLTNARMTFRNVGQGFFYTGLVGDFSFVYDCGSLATKKSLRSKLLLDAIWDFFEECYLVNSHSCFNLNLLVISHFDEDHVNGLSDLLLLYGSVQTIVLPYVSPLERLIILLRNSVPVGTEYFEFLINPVGYFTARTTVGRILFIDNADREKTMLEENLILYDNEENHSDIEINLPKLPKLTNQINIEESIRTQNISAYSHDGVIALPQIWNFKFLNIKMDKYVIDLFEKILFWHGLVITTNADMEKNILTNRRKLSQSYKDLAKNIKGLSNINDTSLIMYHSPIGLQSLSTELIQKEKNKLNDIVAKSSIKEKYKSISTKGISQNQLKNITNSIKTFNIHYKYSKKVEKRMVSVCRKSRRCGTILFGDMNISASLEEFKNHFSEELSQTLVISIPHHGSLHNWDDRLLELFSSTCCGNIIWVSSASYSNAYGHPSARVLQKINKKYNGNIVKLNNEVFEISTNSRVHW